jgi:hypothetical protein
MKLRRWTFLFPLPNSRNSGTIFTVNIIAFKAERVFFYMLTKNFKELQAEVTAHVAADRVAQGRYKTCFIGCLANGHDDPEFIERTYGIPLMVSRIAESIFELLPADEAVDFFAALPEAVGSDGKDLSRVGWKILATELRALPPVPDDTQGVINSVINGMDLLADGKEWPKADAADAAWSADAVWSAADAWSAATAARAAATASAAWSAAARAADAATAATAARAAWSADAAAWSATRLRQRDLLLRLISEAPVNALI